MKDYLDNIPMWFRAKNKIANLQFLKFLEFEISFSSPPPFSILTCLPSTVALELFPMVAPTLSVLPQTVS